MRKLWLTKPAHQHQEQNLPRGANIPARRTRPLRLRLPGTQLGPRPGGPGGGRPSGPGGPGGGGRKFFRRKKVCKFCTEKIDAIPYREVRLLQQFVAERGKIVPRRLTGVCTTHQRKLTRAIKQARDVAGLLDGARQPALVGGADAGKTAGDDLAALGHKLLQQADVAVVDRVDLLGAELADLLAAEELASAAAGATAARGRPPPGPPGRGPELCPWSRPERPEFEGPLFAPRGCFSLGAVCWFRQP